MKAESKTPRELGYRMPAEWEKHEALWLSWPHDPTTFPNRVEKVEETYVQIIKHIHTGEKVNLFAKDVSAKLRISSILEKNGIDLKRICFFVHEYADVWFRDYGPIFVTNDRKELAMVHWIFNSWGEKYQDLLKDCKIPQIINKTMNLKCFEPGIVLEGGSIDVNGKGTILTTEQCLLNKNRNPQLTKLEIEKYLYDYFCAEKIVWLKNGIEGDDTDGHIDDIARFINPTTIACAFEENKDDENYKVLKENYEILQSSTDQNGKPLTIIKLPMPKNIGEKEFRLPASYANFYIGNDTVLLPIFGLKSDEIAISILQKLFPDRKVVGINCSDLVYGLGTIHCITQQQPCMH